MHDSLDLEALKKQIAYLKARTERNKTWIRYIQIALGIMVVMSFVISFLYVNLHLSDKSLLIICIVILVTLLIVHILYPMFVAWRNIREYSARIITYAPEFVYRPHSINIIWELRSHLWLCVVVASSIMWHERVFESPLVAVLLYMLPAILAFCKNYLMVWIYNGGLSRVDTALKVLPASHRLLYFRAIFIYQNQQFAEAETIFRNLLKSRTDYATPDVVLELLVLSEALVNQKRFEEVIPLLEAAIYISPVSELTYVDLAEWYLDHDIDAERAVELLDIALANTPTKQVVLYAAEQAISAHALALTGRTIRAKASLSTASSALDKMPVLVACEANRHMGYAYQALGEIEMARSHFNRAIELAPNDLYGDLARQALESLSIATETV